MFIEQVYRANYKRWQYGVGFIFILISWQFIGSIPLIYSFLRSGTESLSSFIDSQPTYLVFSLMMFPFLVGLIAIITVLNKIHHWRLRSFINLRGQINWRKIVFSFGIWSGVIIISTLVDYMLHASDYVLTFDSRAFLLQLILAVFFISIQSSFEELLFRGYLMRAFGLFSRYRWLPLVATSLIFGIVHGANPEVQTAGYLSLVFYIATGFLLGIITLMDDGMELAIGFHIANNLVSVLLVSSDWSAIKSDAVFYYTSKPNLTTDVWLPVLVIYPLLLSVFSKKYHWKNWKDKLLGRISKPL